MRPASWWRRAGFRWRGLFLSEDLQRLDRLDRERAERFKVLEEFGEAFKDVPVEELEREVARALAEVRAERRAQQAQVVGATA